MNAIISISLLLLAAVLAFLGSELRRGRRVFREAMAHENSGKFEQACYDYAIAMTTGFRRSACRQRIIRLWREHGPFQFSSQHDNELSNFCEYESCGEGFHQIILSDIHRILSHRRK